MAQRSAHGVIDHLWVGARGHPRVLRGHRPARRPAATADLCRAPRPHPGPRPRRRLVLVSSPTGGRPRATCISRSRPLIARPSMPRGGDGRGLLRSWCDRRAPAIPAGHTTPRLWPTPTARASRSSSTAVDVPGREKRLDADDAARRRVTPHRGRNGHRAARAAPRQSGTPCARPAQPGSTKPR